MPGNTTLHRKEEYGMVNAGRDERCMGREIYGISGVEKKEAYFIALRSSMAQSTMKQDGAQGPSASKLWSRRY